MATWIIDPAHSAVTFRIRHLGISWVRGAVRNVRGTVEFVAERPTEISVDAEMDISELSTGNEHRDADLLSDHFFDAEKFPMASFRGRGKAEGKSVFDLEGELTIHGVSKHSILRMESMCVTDDKGERRLGLCLSTTLNRRDFGINWDNKTDSGVPVAADVVEVTADVEAIEQKSP